MHRFVKFVVLASTLCACTDIPPEHKLTSNVKDWRDEVIYQLIVDRFADGDLNNNQSVDPSGLARYQGGDWQGVIDHLDYLKKLGVTALWISPVIRNVDTDSNVDGYHGYWAQDFTLTNPHMGDLAKLREMVDKAHAQGFKVVLDIVANHMGQLFYYDINGNDNPDTNIIGNGSSTTVTFTNEYDPDYDPAGIQALTSLGLSGPADIKWLYIPAIHRMPPMPVEFQNKDWYNRKGRIIDYTKRDQVLTGDFPGGLKDLKTLLPEVQTALAKVYTDWIDSADFDAFRIDTLKHVEYPFWNSFCPAVREHCKSAGKSNFFMFGEVFDGDDQLVSTYTNDEQVDSVVFFPQKFSVIDRVIKFGQSGTDAIETQFKTLQSLYSSVPKTDGPTDETGAPLNTQQLMVNFLDNHDIPRFLYDKNSLPALQQALAFIFFESGIPCVYYGTEQELTGGNDPANRERLWDSGYSTTTSTFGFIQSLSKIRKLYRPLRHGGLNTVWSTPRMTGEDAGIYAFERTDPADGKTVLVVMNVNETQTSSTSYQGSAMKVSFPPGTGLVSVFPDTSVGVPVDGSGKVVVKVPSRGVIVLVAQGDAGGISPLNN